MEEQEYSHAIIYVEIKDTNTGQLVEKQLRYNISVVYNRKQEVRTWLASCMLSGYFHEEYNQETLYAPCVIRKIEIFKKEKI